MKVQLNSTALNRAVGVILTIERIKAVVSCMFQRSVTRASTCKDVPLCSSTSQSRLEGANENIGTN